MIACLSRAAAGTHDSLFVFDTGFYPLPMPPGGTMAPCNGQVLIEAGADPLACDPVGRFSTLHMAVTGCVGAVVDDGVINYLVDNGMCGVESGSRGVFL